MGESFLEHVVRWKRPPRALTWQSLKGLKTHVDNAFGTASSRDAGMASAASSSDLSDSAPASVQSECLQWSLHALLSPLRLTIDSRAAGACWFALREGWLRDHPEAIVALRAACDHSRLQPCQQLLSWSRRAKDVGTTNCIRPKVALATATSTAQWSPARREAGVTQHVESSLWQCHALLAWPPGSGLRYALGT